MPCMLIAMATQTRTRRVPEGVFAATASSPVSQVQARTVPQCRLGKAFRKQWLKRVSHSDMESTSATSEEVLVAHIACHGQTSARSAPDMAISDDWLPMRTIRGHAGPDHMGGIFFPADVLVLRRVEHQGGSVGTDVGPAERSQQAKETPSKIASAPVAESGKRFWLARSHQKLLGLVQQETAARGGRRGLFRVLSKAKRDAQRDGEST